MKNFPLSTFHFPLSTFLICFFIIVSDPVSGQVFTRVINGEGIEKIIPFHIPKEKNQLLMLPGVDVDAVLKQDALNGYPLHRVGVSHDLDFSKSDGEVSEVGSYTMWKIGFESDDATALNIKLDNFYLPEGSMGFIYDDKEFMVIGPIEPVNLFERKYISDFIRSNTIVLKILVPTRFYNEFSVNVVGFTHGFELAKEREYGDSGLCQVDVNCSPVAVSSIARDATVKLLIGGGTASGVMLNNSCNDGRGFCLTAKHSYVNTGAPPSSTVFIFNYDSPDPVTPSCRGSEPAVWLTYFGAIERASSEASSDFTLLELNNSVLNQPSIALAGWNRSTSVPSLPVRIVHHPRGDVKKVTTSINTITVPSSNPTITTIATINPPNSPKPFWRLPAGALITTFGGSTQPGSSGGPWFNANDQVIGQHFGQESLVPPCPASSAFVCGRLDVSWTGGGTNSTRLSNWLGSTSTSVNGVRSPFITGPSAAVCHSAPRTYVLNSPLPGRTVTWAASPASLVLVSSGTGTTAVIRANNANSKGLVTLTFTMSVPSGSTCSTVTISRTVWIGSPTGYTLSISGSNTFCPGQSKMITLNGSLVLNDQSATVAWSYNGALSSLYGFDMSAQAQAANNVGGNGLITATVQNACGVFSPTLFFQIVSCGQGNSNTLSLSPNPTSGIIDVTVLEELSPESSNGSSVYRIFDTNGVLMLQGDANGRQFQLDATSLKSNVYLLEVQTGKSTYRQKLLIAH